MKRVVCLYRVSTTGQVDHDDIPMQRIACREYVNTHPDWEIVKEISEKGVSGYKISTNARDAIVQIKTMAAARMFDVLLVFMFDRLGRRDDETPFVVQWFVSQGIEVWSTREGEQRFDTHVDKLLNYIRFWQASGESEKTAIRVRTKQLQMIQDGLYRGGYVPYGYHLENLGRVNKRNKPVHDLVVDETEADVVREIFHLIVDEGYGTNRVANWLNEQGIPTKKKTSLWRATAIRAIVENPIYVGVIRFGEDMSEPFEHLQIIDDVTFERCITQIKDRGRGIREREVPLRTDCKGLLTGVIYCADCGQRMTYNHNVTRRETTTGTRVYERDVYRCFRKINARTTCKGQSTYILERVEEPVIDAVRTFLRNVKSSPKAEMLRVAERRREGIQETAYQQAQADSQHAQKEIEALEAEAMRILIGEGSFSIEMINTMMAKHKAKLAAAQAKMEELRSAIEKSGDESKKDVQEYEQLLSWAGVFDKASNETKHMIICNLIDRVEVGRDYKISIHFKLTLQQYTGDAA